MPELPEVETIRRQLNTRLKGKKIAKIHVRKPNMVAGSRKKLHEEGEGGKIEKVDRRAKMLVFDLKGPYFIAVHLKMTGQLVYIPPKNNKNGKTISGGHPIIHPEELPNKYSHVIIDFTDKSTLYFNDQRQFGWIRVYKDDELEKVVKAYGVEPLSSKFTFQVFKDLLKRYPNRTIKAFMLDQKLIAGIGNIYADEAAFFAGLKPSYRVARVTEAQAKKLYAGIIHVLKLSIKNKGTSFSDYMAADGNPGGNARFLNVYGRKGLACNRKGCKGEIKKIKLNQRGTHFCNECQK